MSAVPEGMTSADVIVWGEGGTFALQIAAGRDRLKGDELDSVGGSREESFEDLAGTAFR
jgi:hypothetical protein